MDILLYGDNFLKSQPIWSQHIQKPEIENFTLTHDFDRLKGTETKWLELLENCHHITKCPCLVVN